MIPYNPNHQWDNNLYFGASIAALYKLGRLKQYTLVYGGGGNLYFIPDELVGTSFVDSNNIYKIFQHGIHAPDPKNRPFIKSDEALKR